MKTDAYNFYIPDNLIAQKPTDKRSDSRLLVYDRVNDRIVDSFTENITDFLDENFLLVFNNSRVIPARINILKKENNRIGEILVLRIIDSFSLEILTDKVRKYKVGTKIILPDKSEIEVIEDIDELLKIVKSNIPIFDYNYFEKFGKIPLSPYIKKRYSE